MKIAHVTDFYLPRLGGIETHISGLAERQRRAGHDVDVISAGGLVESTERGRLQLDRGDAMLDSFHPGAIRAATAAVVHGDYDAVHVHAGLVTPLAFTTAHVASKAGFATVVTMHSVIGRMSPLYRAADPVSLWTNWPVAWTAVSQTAAAPIRELLGPDRCVTVLPNAVDADDWTVEPVPHREHVQITAVMRLAHRKRPMELLRALRRVWAATNCAVTIHAEIIGEGPERRAMERYATRHDMASWVSLPGRRTHAEIRDAFRRTDLFVAPAIQESFGIAALEARCAGLPIIAMEQAGISEFIEHGRDGLLVADDDGLTSALTLLVRDASVRTSIADHNRRVPAPFGWQETLSRSSIAYERAAALQRTAAHRRASERRVPSGHPAVGARVYQDVPA